MRWMIPENVKTGRCLDIGCGTGNGVVAALKHGASLAVGVDDNLSEFGHEFDVEDFPAICAHYEVDANRAIMIEANIFSIRFAAKSFTYCMMLDSIEHVPDPPRFIRYAHDCLVPGGYLLIETSPLYYSPLGHHLFQYFPINETPWVHLWNDFEERALAAKIDPWSMERFRELNRITHDEIVDAMRETGFEITYEHRSTISDEKLALFDRFKNHIVPELREEKQLLFEDWIVLVGRKQ